MKLKLMRKSEGIGNLTSNLQEDILKHISVTDNANYKSISKETDKDRITILQSLQPLLRGHYINKLKLVPHYEKSRLSFEPTQKGIIYALAHLDVKFDEILCAHREAGEINTCTKFISSLASSADRNELANHFMKFMAEQIQFNDKGEVQKMGWTDKESERILISQTFLDGIQFTDENLQLLNSVSKIKGHLIKLRGQLDSTISSFRS
jgi:hypothetical protein